MNKNILILTDDSIEKDSGSTLGLSKNISKILFLISSMQNKFSISVITTSKNIDVYKSVNIDDVLFLDKESILNISPLNYLISRNKDSDIQRISKMIFNCDVFISLSPDLDDKILEIIVNKIPNYVEKYVINHFRKNDIYIKRKFKFINKTNYSGILDINIELEKKYKNI